MIPLTSNHEDFSSRQHSEVLSRRCFIKKSPLIISKNSQENTYVRVFFDKVASLTLWKTGCVTRVFLSILQHFEAHLFCKTHTHGCFRAFLKPQNKWYNDAKIGIYVVNLHLPWRKHIITTYHIWLQHFTPRYIAKQIEIIQ